MAVSMGSCPECRSPLVYLKLVEGKVKILVACQACQDEVTFDLEKMVNALFNDEPDFEQMLENFDPKGKPN